MRLAVNPNRMELLKLRRRLVLAWRGHKLLEDKQETLMRKFLGLINEYQHLHQEIEKRLPDVFRRFLIAYATMSSKQREEVLNRSKKTANLNVSTTRLMNLTLYHLGLSGEIFLFEYNFLITSGELDIAGKNFLELLPRLVKLAELEKAIEVLAEELEKTRRRVNALEYIFIPAIEETIGYITEKLSEIERANLTRLMRVKEIVRTH